MERRQIRVSGRVQGVGYRYFCQQSAVSAGLTGWVRNTSDGDVELEVQGPAEALSAFQARLADGPPLARVAELNATTCPISKDETSFRITY